MKNCTKCGETKDVGEFYKRKDNKSGLSAQCKTCLSQYAREHRLKPEVLKRQRALGLIRGAGYRDRNRRFVMEFMKNNPCVDCGEVDPLVLELDHREPGEKAFNISDLLGRSRLDLIKEELEKCDVRCANCHRRKTAKQLGWWKFHQVGT